MKIKQILLLLSLLFLVASCIPFKSSTTTSTGANLKSYKYLVFGEEDEKGDDILNDILLKVHNELPKYFEVVTTQKALNLINNNVMVISPKINVETQYWEGGHTYITISFYDFATKEMVVVIKSSGYGMSISQDQKLATFAIRRELKKAMK